jgi:aspartate aminotransferase-like enzyme
MYGLDKACDLILSESLEKRWLKVHEMAQFFRNACRSYGFGIYPKLPADSLTAITLPEGVPTGKLVQSLKEKYGILIANGQADIGLKDKIARISPCDLDFVDTAELIDIINKVQINTTN